MSARSVTLVPAEWRPSRGDRVNILATKESPALPGTWKLIDRAPLGWWAMPIDDSARTWKNRNPNAVTQGCLQVTGRRLVLTGYAPRPDEKGTRR